MTETHIFLVSRTCDRSSNANVLAQDLTVRMFELRCTFAHPKSHPYTTCFIVHSMMYLTHFLLFLPHHLLQTSLPSAGIRMNPSACCLAAWPNKALLHSQDKVSFVALPHTISEVVLSKVSVYTSLLRVHNSRTVTPTHRSQKSSSKVHVDSSSLHFSCFPV